MALASRRIGFVDISLSFEEANQALAALQQRALFFHAILGDGVSEELRAYLADALQATAEAEGRLSAALMGDPDLALGDHFRYPEPVR